MTEDIQKKPKVFLSYAREDRDFAQVLASEFTDMGINVWFEEIIYDMSQPFTDSFKDRVSSSDYIFIILSSHSVNNNWINSSITRSYLNELKLRDVTTIFLRIDNTKIPLDYKQFQYYNIKNINNIRKLVSQIISAPKIDFKILAGRDFELLISELLRKLGFKNIQQQLMIQDREFDISAEYMIKDPFGKRSKEKWLIETKLGRYERIGIGTLDRIVGSVLGLDEKYNVALITNAQLSSYAKNWLENIKHKQRLSIQLIEGPELKQLLLKFPALIEKYFHDEES